MKELTSRERLVLESIIKKYISTAAPVASSQVANFGYLRLSPATIRNIMASLEEKGYIYQPHTSAGRVPTTRGYRFYVDRLMKRGRLTVAERDTIRETLQRMPGDWEVMLREATRILAYLSRQLGVIVSPHLEEGIFHRLDIVRLSSERILLILSIKSGLVKTIMLELRSSVSDRQLRMVERILNERLQGLKLEQIRRDFAAIVRNVPREHSQMIHLLIRNATRLFDFRQVGDVFVSGTQHILKQPEFLDPHKITTVVEAVEDRNVLLRVLDRHARNENMVVKIGEEIGEARMSDCSLIAARYRIGEVAGTLGIIGPTRMNYSHLISLVDYTARILSDIMGQN